MRYKIKEQYGAVVIELSGNVMGGPDAAKLLDEIRRLRDEGKKHIVVELGNVKFMNSSGLGMLISALTTIRNAGGDIRLARVGKKIQSLLIITRLITVFKTYDTVEEAVKSFETEPPEVPATEGSSS